MKRIASIVLVISLFCTNSCRNTSCSRGDAPLIGISCCYDGSSDSAQENYVISIRKAGGVPVILPRVGNVSEAVAILERVDGLVMTGGEDYAPAWYGEEVLNGSVSVNAPRDTSDILLVRTAREMGLPVFGMCRGMQGINVALGGSLYQDIPTQFPGLEHRQGGHLERPSHKVVLDRNSLLYELMGSRDTIAVNSSHHQAVKDPAPGLRITGYSTDGIAESLEGDGILATQFHPECFIASGQDAYLPIFEELVRQAKR